MTLKEFQLVKTAVVGKFRLNFRAAAVSGNYRRYSLPSSRHCHTYPLPVFSVWAFALPNPELTVVQAGNSWFIHHQRVKGPLIVL